MADETPITDILLISSDLFLGSRVRGSAEAAGRSLDHAGSGAMALERVQATAYQLVLVDLETPGLRIAELVAACTGDNRPTVIAYGPHVHEQRLDAARQAGCDRVLTRGQFDATLPKLLQTCLSDQPS